MWSKSLATMAGAIAVWVSVVESASAIGFNFSYELPTGDVISGMLEGEIQTDNNTVIVSDVLMPQFNFSPGPDLPVIDSLSNFLLLPTVSPTVTIDGSFMDFVACVDCIVGQDVGDGFSFFTADQIGTGAGVATGLSYGNILLDDTLPFEADKWSLAIKTPEPASILSLLALGAVATGTHMKRKLSSSVKQ